MIVRIVKTSGVAAVIAFTQYGCKKDAGAKSVAERACEFANGSNECEKKEAAQKGSSAKCHEELNLKYPKLNDEIKAITDGEEKKKYDAIMAACNAEIAKANKQSGAGGSNGDSDADDGAAE